MKNKNILRRGVAIIALVANLFASTGLALAANSYQRAITISNTGGELTNYELPFTLDTAALISANKMRNDCADIRVLNSNLSTNLNFWVQDGTCNSASTKIWVKIPTITSGSGTTINVTYGDLNAASTSDGFNVFPFFDDFNAGSVNTSIWTSSQGTPSVSNGKLVLNSTDGLFAGNYTLPANVIFQSNATALNNPIGGAVRAALSSGTGWVHDPSAGILDILFWGGTAWAETDTNLGGTEHNITNYLTENNEYKITYFGSGTNPIFNFYDNSPTLQTYSDLSGADGAGTLHPVMYVSSGQVSWDYILVRSYAAADPTPSVGDESALGGGQNVPEFSTYMLLLTVMAAGYMSYKKFSLETVDVA